MSAQEILIDGSPTDGLSPWIDSLVWGGAWTGNGTSPVVIGYHTKSGPDVTGMLLRPGQEWLPNERDALANALGQWSSVANIAFVEVGDPLQADVWYWKVAKVDAAGALAWHEVPGYSLGEPLFGAFNAVDPSWSYLNQGGYGFVTMLHEIGHGLGLAHPQDGGAAGDANRFPGVARAADDYGQYDLNQGIWTTMSYNDGWPSDQPALSQGYGYQGTPMALDIAAVQAIYGANTTTRTGDDTYYLPTVNGRGTFWSCIWDAGGDDTVSAASSRVACKINLNEAPLTGSHAGGYVSHVTGIVGGVTIAKGAIIENAVGGRGSDRIIGNAFANELTGGSGQDTLTGGGGGDTFVFGPGESGASSSRADVITDWSMTEDHIDTTIAGTDLNYREGHSNATSIDEAAAAIEGKSLSRDIVHLFLYNDRTDRGFLFSDLNLNGSFETGIVLKGAGSATDLDAGLIL